MSKLKFGGYSSNDERLFGKSGSVNIGTELKEDPSALKPGKSKVQLKIKNETIFEDNNDYTKVKVHSKADEDLDKYFSKINEKNGDESMVEVQTKSNEIIEEEINFEEVDESTLKIKEEILEMQEELEDKEEETSGGGFNFFVFNAQTEDDGVVDICGVGNSVVKFDEVKDYDERMKGYAEAASKIKDVKIIKEDTAITKEEINEMVEKAERERMNDMDKYLRDMSNASYDKENDRIVISTTYGEAHPEDREEVEYTQVSTYSSSTPFIESIAREYKIEEKMRKLSERYNEINSMSDEKKIALGLLDKPPIATKEDIESFNKLPAYEQLNRWNRLLNPVGKYLEPTERDPVIQKLSKEIQKELEDFEEYTKKEEEAEERRGREQLGGGSSLWDSFRDQFMKFKNTHEYFELRNTLIENGVFEREHVKGFSEAAEYGMDAEHGVMLDDAPNYARPKFGVYYEVPFGKLSREKQEEKVIYKYWKQEQLVNNALNSKMFHEVLIDTLNIHNQEELDKYLVEREEKIKKEKEKLVADFKNAIEHDFQNVVLTTEKERMVHCSIAIKLGQMVLFTPEQLQRCKEYDRKINPEKYQRIREENYRLANADFIKRSESIQEKMIEERTKISKMSKEEYRAYREERKLAKYKDRNGKYPWEYTGDTYEAWMNQRKAEEHFRGYVPSAVLRQRKIREAKRKAKTKAYYKEFLGEEITIDDIIKEKLYSHYTEALKLGDNPTPEEIREYMVLHAELTAKMAKNRERDIRIIQRMTQRGLIAPGYNRDYNPMTFTRDNYYRQLAQGKEAVYNPYVACDGFLKQQQFLAETEDKKNLEELEYYNGYEPTTYISDELKQVLDSYGVITNAQTYSKVSDYGDYNDVSSDEDTFIFSDNLHSNNQFGNEDYSSDEAFFNLDFGNGAETEAKENYGYSMNNYYVPEQRNEAAFGLGWMEEGVTGAEDYNPEPFVNNEIKEKVIENMSQEIDNELVQEVSKIVDQVEVGNLTEEFKEIEKMTLDEIVMVLKMSRKQNENSRHQCHFEHIPMLQNEGIIETPDGPTGIGPLRPHHVEYIRNKLGDFTEEEKTNLVFTEEAKAML